MLVSKPDILFPETVLSEFGIQRFHFSHSDVVSDVTLIIERLEPRLV